MNKDRWGGGGNECPLKFYEIITVTESILPHPALILNPFIWTSEGSRGVGKTLVVKESYKLFFFLTLMFFG